MSKRQIAKGLSAAAAAIPPADRRAFRAFLAEQSPKPKARKVHSWHRKPKTRARAAKPKRQGELSL